MIQYEIRSVRPISISWSDEERGGGGGDWILDDRELEDVSGRRSLIYRARCVLHTTFQVTIVGEVQKYPTNDIYIIDDGTGTVEAVTG